MASINDVFEELQAVNTNLGLIHADGIAQTNATNQVRSSVDIVDGDIKSGFAATVNALHVIATIDIAAVKLLFHLTQQSDAIICALEHISQNTCAILTQTTIQTRLQTGMAADTRVMRELAEMANPAAALELERLAKLQAEIQRCCPPQTPPPACTYAPCPAPKPVGMPDLPRFDPKPLG
jgi:hypothetical protein